MVTDPYALDAPFYDTIHGEAGEDLNFWIPFATEQGGSLLEVGTGTGRIAIPLARAGHSVIGLDPSPAMLNTARERAAAEDLNIKFLTGRLPDTVLPSEPFTTIIMPNDVLLACTTPSEQITTLRAAALALAPQGRLAIDVAGPGHWLEPKFNDEPFLAFSGSFDGKLLNVWHTHQDDLASQVRRLHILYELSEAQDPASKVESEHLMRYVRHAELACMLKSAGLRILDCWGSYSLGALTDTSERLIVTAEPTERSS